jgi:hypothetical protein
MDQMLAPECFLYIRISKHIAITLKEAPHTDAIFIFMFNLFLGGDKGNNEIKGNISGENQTFFNSEI